MFDWLIGSIERIKTEINTQLTAQEPTSRWQSFESSNKDYKADRINDVMTPSGEKRDPAGTSLAGLRI
jgi:hypothetical protein